MWALGWIGLAGAEKGLPGWLAGAIVLTVGWGGPVALLRFAMARRRRRWRAAGEALGLDFQTGRQQVALRGDVDGLRVDFVWARREGHSYRGYSSSSRSYMHSGARLRVQGPVDLLPFEIRGASGLHKRRADPARAALLAPASAALDELFAWLPEADIEGDSITGPATGLTEREAIVATVEVALGAARALLDARQSDS
ncbi:MAG: hypothetical protein AAFZ65_07405 [Planctomycetota bacterium]